MKSLRISVKHEGWTRPATHSQTNTVAATTKVLIRAGHWLTQSVAILLSAESVYWIEAVRRLSSLLSPPETRLVVFRAIVWRVSWAYAP